MSMFRRPTDDSSESDSDANSSEDGSEVQIGAHDRSDAGVGESLRPELTATETLSSEDSISVGFEGNGDPIQNAEHHRNMMLASLLEDFYKGRAAELFTAANPGTRYHRESPEVLPLARNLFTQASQNLASAGILPASTASESNRNTRQQYLVGFSNLGLQNLQENSLLPESIRRRISNDNGNMALVKPERRAAGITAGTLERPIQDLAAQAGALNLMTHPANDLLLSSSNTYRSHYQSSFQETRLLGKGGFGRVYQTFNYFDKREYAVKKIPLSPKLSQKYREHGHAELHHVLREVQALAQLDHCNVVRYHATWIEEPRMSGHNTVSSESFRKTLFNQKLLHDKPASTSDDELHGRRPGDLVSGGQDDRVMFAPDSHASRSMKPDLGWSMQRESHNIDQSSLANSDIFTDGALRRLSHEKTVDDPYCYVLHVQMSMYPVTLTQYLQVPPPANRTLSATSLRRHCFHLVPSLKMMLGLLSGLQYVHNKGLVHRDIKPSNIFLSTRDEQANTTTWDGFYDVGSCAACKNSQSYFVNPRIGDFGLVADLARGDAASSASSSSSSDRAVGTQYYNPPHRDHGEKGKLVRIIDEKLDVFALGVILVEMLCVCDTSMQRLDLLKGLQAGQIPQGLPTAISREGYGAGIVDSVQELVHGMIDEDQGARWMCSKVKAHVQNLLELL